MAGRPKPDDEALLDRITVGGEGGCWPWSGALKPNGYGALGRRRYGELQAHRAVYVMLRGPIPAGMELDHLCRNRACVNPWHMEPVSHRENLMRGDTFAARRASQTHCLRGHEFTPENTRVRKNGTRNCLSCAAEQRRARRAAAA